jgi:hypothetical protein
MRPGRARRAARAGAAAITLLVLVIPSALAQSAQPVEAWRRSIPNHVGVMMDLDANDNVFALGYGTDVVTRKYSPNGTLQWERSLPDRALPSWVSADPSGNAVVAAYTITGVNTPAGWRVVKYGPGGGVLWEDTIPATSGRTVRVETDSLGNAYVVGTMALVNEFGNFTLDAVTIKYAPNGTRLWTRVFNGGEYTTDRPASLAISEDGSRIAIVGGSSGWVFAVMYDAQGNQVGQLLRDDLIFSNDAAFGPQNQLYVGTTRWTPETGDQMTIVKLGAEGNVLFTRSYPDGELIYRMGTDSQGNVVAAGVKDTYFNWVTLKVEPDGDRLWSQVYDGFGANDERPFFLTIDRFDDIYVTGDGGPAPPGSTISNTQSVTVKYSASGTQEWVILDTPGARGVAVRIGTDLAVYVQELGQMLTVRYDQPGAASQSPPAAPSGLTVTGRTRTQISLRWVNNSTDQDGVKIQRCRGTGCTNFVQIAQVSGTSTSYVDTGLTRNATYRYRVRAFNESGNSPWSNILTARKRQ